MRLLGHILAILLLTLLTQIGGLAWLMALRFKRVLLAFLLLYAVLLTLASLTAPLAGRGPLHCHRDGPLQVQSWFYCLTARNYMKPELIAALEDAAERVDTTYPGTQTLVLDASFPFLDGFPMLPHLSHDDGEKVDLAFYYEDETGYLPGQTRSPIGFFAFEPGPTQCPPLWPTLRWDLEILQPLWQDYALETSRTRALLEALAADPRIGKILLEPYLTSSLGLSSDKIRFQGCRAARHDDHIHLQL